LLTPEQAIVFSADADTFKIGGVKVEFLGAVPVDQPRGSPAREWSTWWRFRITRQHARKLIRRIIAAAEKAEALQHASGLVRTGLVTGRRKKVTRARPARGSR